MAESGQGTIIFTGATAALRGGKNFALLSVPKFALRGLSQNIAREFQPQVSASCGQSSRLSTLVEPYSQLSVLHDMVEV